MNHPGEELVIVTRRPRCGSRSRAASTRLGTGDSIHFRTLLPHSWRNPAAEPAHAIWLVVRSS